MSIAASLPAIDRAVDELSARAKRRHDALIVVHGEPSAGKSTVLARFAQRMRDANQRPVLDLRVLRGFEAAARGGRYGLSDDAGVVLLTTAAQQLARANARPRELLESGSATWELLSKSVAEALSSTDAIVVIDDVLTDPVDPTFDSFFAQRTRDALDVLLAEGTTRVVSALPRTVSAHEAIVVEAKSRAGEMLAPSLWNGLGPSAAKLSSAADHAALAQLSPLELRLAVSLVSLGVQPRDVLDGGARSMVRALFQTLGEQGALLRRFLARLALSRRPFGDDLLTALGVDELDASTQSLLRHGVLYEEAGRYALHETFAREASAFGWLSDLELRAAHDTIAKHHTDALVAAASSSANASDVLEHELEAFHHLGLAGRSDTGSIRVWLAEQLDTLGKALSLRGLRDEAVSVYERAIARDANDWYAHHYLAFNLDVQGKDAPRVETAYKEARRLHEMHVWHHGRLACFYATRSRTRDAEGTFRRAERLLDTRYGLDQRLYSELHRPLARLLLHRGQLDFARAVLDAVPGALRGDARWWRALDQLHHLLAEAERDEAVFPPLDVPADERWSAPHLVNAPVASLLSWTPGRVTHVDDRGLTLRISPRRGVYGWRDIPAADLPRLWRASEREKTAGTYVEIVAFTDGQEEILAHRPWPIPDLPALDPAPDRYLRALMGHAAPDGA